MSNNDLVDPQKLLGTKVNLHFEGIIQEVDLNYNGINRQIRVGVQFPNGDGMRFDYDEVIQNDNIHEWCKLRKEYDKLPIAIQKKIIGLMRMGGAKIKVQFNNAELKV